MVQMHMYLFMYDSVLINQKLSLCFANEVVLQSDWRDKRAFCKANDNTKDDKDEKD